jgi:phosphoribosylformylglycinamidine (FGAM) synthase-like enzyme
MRCRGDHAGAGFGAGLAIACGLATGLKGDPYRMTLAAIDECVRNLVCVGADPDRIAILDNFCWPVRRSRRTLGALVRAAEACYDGRRRTAHRSSAARTR